MCAALGVAPMFRSRCPSPRTIFVFENGSICHGQAAGPTDMMFFAASVRATWIRASVPTVTVRDQAPA
jgi:hypothetical protein